MPSAVCSARSKNHKKPYAAANCCGEGFLFRLRQKNRDGSEILSLFLVYLITLDPVKSRIKPRRIFRKGNSRQCGRAKTTQFLFIRPLAFREPRRIFRKGNSRQCGRSETIQFLFIRPLAFREPRRIFRKGNSRQCGRAETTQFLFIRTLAFREPRRIFRKGNSRQCGRSETIQFLFIRTY